MASSRRVNEGTREREAHLYAADLLRNTRLNTSGKTIPATELRTSPDGALTALAQLGALRTGTSRSLVSLFDENNQHVVAEATPTIPLAPGLGLEDHGEELWLCGTAIPRQHGVCDYSVCGEDPDAISHHGCEPNELPLTKVDDLTASPTFSSKPYCLPGSPAVFYAAVPIRTKRGINIGVYCVIHSEPVPWHDHHTQILRGISQILMHHFEGMRERISHRRTERMNRGLGSFLEDEATLSGWKDGSFPEAYDDLAGTEGSLNVQQQAALTEETFAIAPNTSQMSSKLYETTMDQPGAPDLSSEEVTGPIASSSPVLNQKPLPILPISSPTEANAPTRHPGQASVGENSAAQILGKAANILRESMETEGCLFVDPSRTAFGSMRGPEKRNSSSHAQSLSSCSSSNDETGSQAKDETPAEFCKILGFSSSTGHSVNGDIVETFQKRVGQKLVASLCRRYPRGKVFNFDSSGELLSSDSSDNSLGANEDVSNCPTIRKIRQSSRQIKPWARGNEGSSILELFPKARSVAFMPIWNTKKERWYAAQFAYTHTPCRSYTVGRDLNYMRAFGMLIMDAILRLETLRSSNAMSDALSCMSHELRSPLHGILLSVELLHETNLSVFQGDLSHTIQTCCRTLLETLDHLLDYSNINNYDSASRKRAGGDQPRRFRNGSKRSVKDGLMSLRSTVDVSLLAEEVVESVFAGFSYQHKTIRDRSASKQHKSGSDWQQAGIDGLKAQEDLNIDGSHPQELTPGLGNTMVFLVIDPQCQWMFQAESGAIRRIVMNLFGNALKYTRTGAIKVSLTQGTAKIPNSMKAKQVIINVTDSGIGMSQAYMDSYLYTPFTQEDSLSPGSGLGLSIVKRIVSSMRGRLSVQSQRGVGTTITASIPLQAEPSLSSGETTPDSAVECHRARVEQLQGLRVCLAGFKRGAAHSIVGVDEGAVFDGFSILRSMCAELLKLEVVDELTMSSVIPDLVILSEDTYESWLQDAKVGKIPIVVVCSNAPTAHQRTMRHSRKSHGSQGDLLEFISQPIGPLKLSKVLLLVFNRWQNLQSSSDTPPSVASGSSPSEDDPIVKTPITPSPLPTNNPFESEKAGGRSSSLKPEARPPLRPHFSRSMSRTGLPFLLVDDNSINLRILSVYMTKLRQKFSTATNGKEALDAYVSNAGSCRCVFMDISMPVMDGLEATRAIRSYESDHKVPPALIVALTGLASSEAQNEAFASGVDLFLTKPVKLVELSAVLQDQNLLVSRRGASKPSEPSETHPATPSKELGSLAGA